MVDFAARYSTRYLLWRGDDEGYQRVWCYFFVLTEQADAWKAVVNELEMAFRFQRFIVPVRIKSV